MICNSRFENTTKNQLSLLAPPRGTIFLALMFNEGPVCTLQGRIQGFKWGGALTFWHPPFLKRKKARMGKRAI